MMKMYFYEIKKILRKRSSVVALITVSIYILIMMISPINNVHYIKENGERISGIKAIRENRRVKREWNGLLTEKVIADVVEKTRVISNDPKYQTEQGLSDVGHAKLQGFEDIRDLINTSFSDFRCYDYNRIDAINPSMVNMFYPNRLDKLKIWLQGHESGNNFSQREKEYIIKSADKVSTPFKYSYMDGWDTVLKFSKATLFAVIIVICILIAPVFAMEYQLGTDAIFLSSKNGKRKAIFAKIASAFTVASVVYFIGILVCSGILLILYGADGANCPIQTKWIFWGSFYNFTNIKAFWMVIGLGYVGCLFMSSLTMWFSAKLKTSFSAIILSFLIIMVPAVLGEIIMKPVVKNVLKFLPHQTLQGGKLLELCQLYNIGNKVMNPYEILPMIYISLSILLIPLTYKVFKKRQLT